MDINERRKRANLYFSRSYRHFEVNTKEQLVFVFALVVPIMILFLLFYTELSHFVSNIVRKLLILALPSESVKIVTTDFLLIFGDIYFLELVNSLPEYSEIFINLIITLLLLTLSLFLVLKGHKKTPLPIYFSFILLIHLVSCLYFLFAKDYFPYSATEYSNLYMEQQIILWFALLVLNAFVLGVIGYGKIRTRVILFFIVIIYAFVYGIARYLTFCFVISAGSSLYMATLFFTLGPLYEFIYFVFFYSIFINREIKYFGYGEGRTRWQWL